jgi:hypothetical protein
LAAAVLRLPGAAGGATAAPTTGPPAAAAAVSAACSCAAAAAVLPAGEATSASPPLGSTCGTAPVTTHASLSSVEGHATLAGEDQQVMIIFEYQYQSAQTGSCCETATCPSEQHRVSSSSCCKQFRCSGTSVSTRSRADCTVQFANIPDDTRSCVQDGVSAHASGQRHRALHCMPSHHRLQAASLSRAHPRHSPGVFLLTAAAVARAPGLTVQPSLLCMRVE